MNGNERFANAFDHPIKLLIYIFQEKKKISFIHFSNEKINMNTHAAIFTSFAN